MARIMGPSSLEARLGFMSRLIYGAVMSEHILVETSAAVMALRLNRPDKKNALTHAMYSALAAALERAAHDETIRVTTILGSGGAFTAGNDLKDFMETPPLGTDQPVFRFLRAISSFPKPLIAGVTGPAIGVGTTMLLHCDLVVAAASALFHMPFVDLGLVPEAASSLLFPRLVGPQLAARHLILGDPFDAEAALRYGMIGEIVAEEELEARVGELAARVAAKPPEGVRLTKQLIRGEAESVATRIEREGELFAQRLQSAEAAKAFGAFFARR
jgi:enoyl-CoA hydratase/carnithine racemase